MVVARTPLFETLAATFLVGAGRPQRLVRRRDLSRRGELHRRHARSLYSGSVLCVQRALALPARSSGAPTTASKRGGRPLAKGSAGSRPQTGPHRLRLLPFILEGSLRSGSCRSGDDVRAPVSSSSPRPGVICRNFLPGSGQGWTDVRGSISRFGEPLSKRSRSGSTPSSRPPSCLRSTSRRPELLQRMCAPAALTARNEQRRTSRESMWGGASSLLEDD